MVIWVLFQPLFHRLEVVWELFHPLFHLDNDTCSASSSMTMILESMKSLESRGVSIPRQPIRDQQEDMSPQ